MQLPAILLTIAAFGGITMLGLRRDGRRIPTLALALPHTLVVVAAAVALATAVHERSVPTITMVALSGFIVAAVAGTVFFLRLLQQEKARPLTYIHQLVAAISVIMFLVCVFGP